MYVSNIGAMKITGIVYHLVVDIQVRMHVRARKENWSLNLV